MPFEQIIGLVGVVTGAILGYLASYLNNRQQEKWKLENEYRTWKRTRITEDFKQVTPIIQKFTELAHFYVEYYEDQNNHLAKARLDNKITDVTRFMREDLVPFPVSLKHSIMENALNDLDKATDKIELLSLHDNKDVKTEEMLELLNELRSIEKGLHDNYQKMIADTFIK